MLGLLRIVTTTMPAHVALVAEDFADRNFIDEAIPCAATTFTYVENLHGLSLNTRAVDPFLVLVARTPRELAEFIVWERLERGVVTSLGSRIQKVARAVGKDLHSSGVPEADVEVLDSGLQRHHLMQLKLGPDTINKTMAAGIASALQRAEAQIKAGGLPDGWIVVKMLGMCYGQPKHRSSFVAELGSKGVDVENIGRTFWEFVTRDPEAYKEIFAAALQVAVTYKNASNKTLPQAIQDGIMTMTAEIDSRYGDSEGGIDWQKLLEDNM